MIIIIFKVVRNVENFVCHFCCIFIYQAKKSTDHFNTKNIYMYKSPCIIKNADNFVTACHFINNVLI